MEMTTRLTEDKDWDELWATLSLPQVIKAELNPYYIESLDAFFHKYLPKNEKYEFLELGCTPGRWLHYFNYEFGYAVSGLDNSSVGLEVTRKNLELLNVTAKLHNSDVMSFTCEKNFDIVFSLGLIEHFNPPDEILEKHLELVRKGGYVVIGVPNIKKAIYGHLQRLINKKNLAGYIHISATDLVDRLKEKIEIIFCGHVGVLTLYLLNIPPHKIFVHKIIGITQFALDKIMTIFRISKETKLCSPYIFIIGKKI
jgi:SAM-dependent methyltransferase